MTSANKGQIAPILDKKPILESENEEEMKLEFPKPEMTQLANTTEIMEQNSYQAFSSNS